MQSDDVWFSLGVSETIPSGWSAFIAYPLLPADGLLDTRRTRVPPGAKAAENDEWGGVMQEIFLPLGAENRMAVSRRRQMPLSRGQFHRSAGAQRGRFRVSAWSDRALSAPAAARASARFPARRAEDRPRHAPDRR